MKILDDMKRVLTFILVFVTVGASAQEVTAPRFRGGDIRYFASCLSSEIEKAAVGELIPASELLPRLGVGFTVDTTGGITRWRFLDNTCEGRDSCDLKPAPEALRSVATRVFGQLEGAWTPARKEGRAVPFDVRLTLHIPVERIERLQNPDPLLFLGEDPARSLHPWVRVRMRYDERFAKIGGRVHVRFFVEPDGKVTIDEVVDTPDPKLSKEVIRVLRNTRGKWTPRKVDGVPQRTAYDYRVNYINDTSE